MKIEFDLVNSLLPFIIGFTCGGVLVSGIMLFIDHLEKRRRIKC